MRYQIVPVTPFEQNCTIFWCEKTRQAVVIDPGGDIERVLRALEDEKLTLAKVLVTHGHIDHAGGVAACESCHTMHNSKDGVTMSRNTNTALPAPALVHTILADVDAIAPQQRLAFGEREAEHEQEGTDTYRNLTSAFGSSR